MANIKTQWKTVTNKGKWTARVASFVAKAKATKLVWFPPKPAQTAKKTTSTTNQATKNTTEQTRGAVKATTASTKNPGTPHAHNQHPAD